MTAENGRHYMGGGQAISKCCTRTFFVQPRSLVPDPLAMEMALAAQTGTFASVYDNHKHLTVILIRIQ